MKKIFMGMKGAGRLEAGAKVRGNRVASIRNFATALAKHLVLWIAPWK